MQWTLENLLIIQSNTPLHLLIHSQAKYSFFNKKTKRLNTLNNLLYKIHTLEASAHFWKIKLFLLLAKKKLFTRVSQKYFKNPAGIPLKSTHKIRISCVNIKEKITNYCIAGKFSTLKNSITDKQLTKLITFMN